MLIDFDVLRTTIHIETLLDGKSNHGWMSFLQRKTKNGYWCMLLVKKHERAEAILVSRHLYMTKSKVISILASVTGINCCDIDGVD